LLSARTGLLTSAHLGLTSSAFSSVPSAGTGSASLSVPASGREAAPPQTLRAAEEAAIIDALERHPHDRRAAAKSLGLSRSAFYRRLAQYGLSSRK
jgi:DNA-binding NtrC family response regulator